MIFWFSGTGNSKYVAERIAEANGLALASIAEIMRGRRFEQPEGEVIGIVFPVFAYAPPKMVLDFAKRLRRDAEGAAYVFAVCTCGGSAAYSMRKLERTLKRPLDCAYSISMPGNYILGLDVDSEEVQAKKLADAEGTIAEINGVIAAREKGVRKVRTGPNPWVRSTLISPLFNWFLRSARGFYATDACTSCGLCAAVCPTSNVTVPPGGKPSWGKDCTLCLACIHHCPVRAIQRGKATESKGRYVNPNCKIQYDFK